MSSPSTTSTLIARIPYLNTEPFYRTFQATGYELLDLPPRQLGEAAAKGRVVAGPMSLCDWLNLEEQFEPLGPYGIASLGAVRSVLLFSRKPIEELAGGSIAITEETSTSVRLLEVLFRDYWGVRPAVWRRGTTEPTDAMLLIGDAALRARAARLSGAMSEYPVMVDLAAAWSEWQKKPFVFALWVVKRDLPLEEKKILSMRFEDSLYEGLKAIPIIATERSADLGLPPDELEAYLRHFRYRLGPDDWEGLNTFRRLIENVRHADG
ncbi:MAG TPA: menaquinone biosynthesis protein [Candidatus Eisenbacteria bacterium]